MRNYTDRAYKVSLYLESEYLFLMKNNNEKVRISQISGTKSLLYSRYAISIAAFELVQEANTLYNRPLTLKVLRL